MWKGKAWQKVFRSMLRAAGYTGWKPLNSLPVRRDKESNFENKDTHSQPPAGMWLNLLLQGSFLCVCMSALHLSRGEPALWLSPSDSCVQRNWCWTYFGEEAEDTDMTEFIHLLLWLILSALHFRSHVANLWSVASFGRRLKGLGSRKRLSSTGPSSHSGPLCHEKNHVLLLPGSLQLLQLVDDFHRYLTVEEIFGDSSNYTCERTWLWISLIWRPIKWWHNYENNTKAHWWNWPGTVNYQGRCGRVLCGLNNSGGAWYHQGSSPPGKRVHSFPKRTKINTGWISFLLRLRKNDHVSHWYGSRHLVGEGEVAVKCIQILGEFK